MIPTVRSRCGGLVKRGVVIVATAVAVAATLMLAVSASAVCIPVEGGTLKFRPATGRLLWKARDKSIEFLMADPALGTTSIAIAAADTAVLTLNYGSGSASAWRSFGTPPTKWQYKDVDDPSPIVGVRRITSRPTRFTLRGRGGVLNSLSAPTLLPIAFQVTDSNGGCIEVAFSSCKRNNANGIKCRRDVEIDTFTADTPNSLDTIIDDVTLPHQARLHGLPLDFDWALAPIGTAGNNAPANYSAMTGWGQVYEGANGNRAKNTRIQIRNFRSYVLSKQDNQWHLLQSPASVVGGAWREDFLDNINKPADIRAEADGGISVKVGGGYNFHFFPQTRATIVPGDIGGIFVTTQARLILDDPSGRDDRSRARYLLDIGGDYWIDLFTEFDDFTTNTEIFLARFRYVTTGWHWFNMTSLSEAEIRQNPPPLQ
ncbi:MAG: hypothetical protein ACE5EO_11590 [Candidatus Krumholzibacteriia bacterium]